MEIPANVYFDDKERRVEIEDITILEINKPRTEDSPPHPTCYSAEVWMAGP
jgi:hypothetical protein